MQYGDILKPAPCSLPFLRKQRGDDRISGTAFGRHQKSPLIEQFQLRSLISDNDSTSI